MEGFGLQEQGILEVLDPDDSAAIAALEARVESSRSSRPDPPPVRAGSVAAGDEDSAAAALRLTKGRPPPGLEGQLAPPTDLGDFSDTIAGDAGALRPLSDELPTLDAMLASRERAVTDVSSTDGPGPDTWERSGVLDTAQLGAVSSGGSSVGADSEDRVPAFVSDEIRTLEGDLESGELELGDPLELSLGSEGREEDSSGGRLILDSSSGAVALVEDSMYRVPPLEMSAEVTPADLMAVYEGLKVVARSELGTRAVQLGTRSGRVLVSAIPEEDRRAAIGAFSAQAIAFASEDS